MAQATTSQDGADDYQRLAAEQAIATEQLVADLGIPAGARVLDVACGTGHAALAAARRRAHVIGVDIDERPLERARQRARAEALEEIEFIKADGRELAYAEGSFDYVLSTLGLVFFPDQPAAAKELARLVRPGGKIALTAYATFSVPSLMFDFGHEIVGATKPNYPHYAWSQGPRAGTLLNPYFDDVQLRYKSFDTCFPSAQAWVDHVALWNPNMRRSLAAWPDETGKAWREGALKILEPHNRAADGTFTADITYAVITGTRKR